MLSEESLSEVDWIVLYWLLAYPFQRAEHLALMLNYTPSSVYQHLQKLHAMNLIESLTPPSLDASMSCRLYHLSNNGLHLLAKMMQMEPARLAQEWNMDEAGLQRLLPRLHALTILHTCIASLFAYAPSAQPTSQGQRATIRWHWLHDYRHSFQHRERRSTCTADALLAWQAPSQGEELDTEQWWSMVLLLDTGLAETTHIRDGLEQWVRLRENAERWSVYQHFPPLLVLVPTLHHAEQWQRRMREVATSMCVDGLVGAILTYPSLLTRHTQGPLANIWTLPCHYLATHAPCRLQDLLRPCPQEALLPGFHDHLEKTKFQRWWSNGPSTWQSEQRQKRLITGHFFARSQTSFPSDHAVSPLESLQLGQRHLHLLTLLNNHALLTSEEIAAILNAQEESVNRYLRSLHQRKYVTTWHCTGESPRWHVTERGLRMLAVVHRVHVLRLGMYRSVAGEQVKTLVPKDLEQLQRYPKHLAGIYGFLATFHRAVRQQDVRVTWWETGTHCERSYTFQGRQYNLRPDAECEFVTENNRQRLWLEWDGGTMNRRDLEAKMNAYAHYIHSREWAREGVHLLPLLLFVVPDKGQEERVKRVAREKLSQTGVVLYTTTASRVYDQGPLAAIWVRILPKSGSGEERVTFHFIG